MKIKVLIFGQLKDLIGCSQAEIELDDGATVETVFGYYSSQCPELTAMAKSIALARNQRFSARDELLQDGDEVALMPPVSGGKDWLDSREQDGVLTAITSYPIDSRKIAKRIQSNKDGALIIFEGVVRNYSGDRQTEYLDYECYVPLAMEQMEQIGLSILQDYDVHRIALVHRIGRLQIREVSVSIVVVAAHRHPAYKASLEAINQLKRKVPIWKKEYFEDGGIWVEGEWDNSVPLSDKGPV